MNKLSIILALIILTGLLATSFMLGRQSVKVAITDSSRVLVTEVPVEYTITRTKIKAEIDTVWVNNTSHEIARYSTQIDTSKVSVKLDIKYDEDANLFDIRHSFRVIRDSVFVERIKTVDIFHKPKPISVTAGTLIGFREKQLDNAGLDLGLKFANKYTLAVFGKSNQEYGLRMSVDF